VLNLIIQSMSVILEGEGVVMNNPNIWDFLKTKNKQTNKQTKKLHNYYTIQIGQRNSFKIISSEVKSL